VPHGTKRAGQRGKTARAASIWRHVAMAYQLPWLAQADSNGLSGMQPHAALAQRQPPLLALSARHAPHDPRPPL